VAEQVSRLLGHPEAEAAFPACLPNGKRHVLIALSTDAYGPLLARVKKFRGPVNVAIGSDTGQWPDVIAFYPSSADTGAQAIDDCIVSANSEIGMLVALLRGTRKPTRVHLAKPKYDAELVDQEAPAAVGA
jgi:hypothetical protein